MAKNDNLHDFLVDIADAIREKTETTDLINPQDFSDKIKSIKGSENSVASVWTGHADVEGLKAIGWTDEDIEYYQQYGVNWNEEDDKYHLVSDENKAMYGVINADNIADYKNSIVYLPKIDTSDVTDTSYFFASCKSLVAIPLLDTSKVTNMDSMFYGCYNLTSIPLLDTSKVTNMDSMFYGCYLLKVIPAINTSNVTAIDAMFAECYSLISVPQLGTSNVTTMRNVFYSCYSLQEIPELNTSKVTNMNTMLSSCYSLTSCSLLDCSSNTTAALFVFMSCYLLRDCKIKNLSNCTRIMFTDCFRLNKESVLYLINNEKLTATCTVALPSNVYEVLYNDADIISALEKHPNILLAII